MPIDDALRDWLLDSDPALMWRVQRDLLGEPDAVWQATQQRVATEGFGARLLALQDADGQWAGGSYFPKDFDFSKAGTGQGQPYTATTWSLNSLRDWGLDAAALAGTANKLEANSRWDYDDLPYWQGEVDACINGFTLANGAWLGADVSVLARWFVDHQMEEGGWNCEWVNGSTRSSFDSTLNSMRGILYYEEHVGGSEDLRAARHAGEEYLLKRNLLNRLTTGEPVDPAVTHFTYPFRWRYTALNALDYFREARLYDDTAPDQRMSDAIDIVRSARTQDGRWIQGTPMKGEVWFEVDVPEGEPSKWLTFYATRVLDWWDARSSG